MGKNHTIAVGEAAPEFALESAAGETVRLSDFRGKSEVVVFFYPKNNTPACTIEACSFRDSYEAFRAAGAEVIGISADSTSSHQSFRQNFKLPFLQLSDPGGKVAALYGVPKTLGVFPGRTTFVIDRQGVVRHVFSSQLQPTKHVKEALQVLESLRAERAETT
ncbi:MAG: peroxiredoxin [Isosphaeraceae bacterium]